MPFPTFKKFFSNKTIDAIEREITTIRTDMDEGILKVSEMLN